MKKTPKQEWTALCRDCRFTGKRQAEQIEANQDVKNHLKTHPGHHTRVFVTGEKALTLPSTSLTDEGGFPNLPIKNKV
jgi:hypothetical protein